jgi:hypothetical protein
MTIETKYNIGDEVWFLSYHSPRKARIYGMSIYVSNSGKVSLLYSITEKDVYWLKREKDLFSTKEELLNSL